MNPFCALLAVSVVVRSGPTNLPLNFALNVMSGSFRIFGSVANVTTRIVSCRWSVFKRHLKS